ncbi:hypothetical protein C3747_88g51 [Trypanosoma cruzi]|uniref:Uncharacterized protein n=2 Tax=Trypanosoma cruzi TaxID=5693 RepID=Q4D836_TRYCC|nr:hypothetical protein, conserved [Trypanosoma cruzi]EAN88680.1 hypothetical protein, conserved [Trypanosoma cruzi]KAF8298077.1 hypothetical protein TcYC6_0075810 [Trypanosoma cruzi]PWV08624.1 hypothetical protein C3747_88g51 [Trypanosoma cruzi]|eukprot:XP_810531.1 hypothetical protein [Trypanosoma cruzi strain CL Brener]
MNFLTSEPTKWADTVEFSIDCLFSSQSARNVDDVLSKASTRKHQKNLLKAVEPCIPKMIENPNGISILTSLVKYGTILTVSNVTRIVLHSCEKVLTCEKAPVEVCEAPLGVLLERILYREDCTEDCRINLIKILKSLDHSLLLGSSVFLLATARLMIFDRAFAVSVCSNIKAKKAFFQLFLIKTKKNVVIRFCELVLSTEERREDLTDLCSVFVFNALHTLYTANSSLRPWKEVTMLLASCGCIAVVREMVKLLSEWPDISVYLRNEHYAKVIACLLARNPEMNDGIVLLKVLFQKKEDFDEIMASRKSSQLRLLAAIAEKPAYVAALSETLGESLGKRLLAAAVRYRNINKPKALTTKEALLQRIDKIRSVSGAIGSLDKTLKRRRE